MDHGDLKVVLTTSRPAFAQASGDGFPTLLSKSNDGPANHHTITLLQPTSPSRGSAEDTLSAAFSSLKDAALKNPWGPIHQLLLIESEII